MQAGPLGHRPIRHPADLRPQFAQLEREPLHRTRPRIHRHLTTPRHTRPLACLCAPRNALFKLTEALLCTDGPVMTLVELLPAAEHRRGHGALYAALDPGWMEPTRLRRTLAGLPRPRAADGRVVLAVDASNWLRPDASTGDDRLFCHVHGCGNRKTDQFVPGWQYSFVSALESGRTSWVALLDAVRLGPADDATLTTAAHLRGVVKRLGQAEHWQPGGLEILIVWTPAMTSPTSSTPCPTCRSCWSDGCARLGSWMPLTPGVPGPTLHLRQQRLDQGVETGGLACCGVAYSRAARCAGHGE